MAKKIYVCCQHPAQYDEYSRRMLQAGAIRDYQCVTDPARIMCMYDIDAVLLPIYDPHLALAFKDMLQATHARWQEDTVYGD